MSGTSTTYQTLTSTSTRTATAPTSAAAMTENALPSASQPRHAGIVARPSLGGGAVLKLRGAHAAPTGRSVSWADDVIDNEGLGRKKSKVCCIYHRPRAVDESSDESSSGSDSDSDTEPDLELSEKSKGPAHPHTHNHNHNTPADKSARKPSPNAYERVPRNRPRAPAETTTAQR